jgi:hypothetical protein
MSMTDNLPPGCTQADIDRRYRDPADEHADAVKVCTDSREHWQEFLVEVGVFLFQRDLLASEGDLWAIMQGFEGILYAETSDARKELEEAGFDVLHLPSMNERTNYIAGSINFLLAGRSA